jgi:hypothetical protein
MLVEETVLLLPSAEPIGTDEPEPLIMVPDPPPELTVTVVMVVGATTLARDTSWRESAEASHDSCATLGVLHQTALEPSSSSPENATKNGCLICHP